MSRFSKSAWDMFRQEDAELAHQHRVHAVQLERIADEHVSFAHLAASRQHHDMALYFTPTEGRA